MTPQMQTLEEQKEAHRKTLEGLRKIPASCFTLGQVLDTAKLARNNEIGGLTATESGELAKILEEVRAKYALMTDFYKVLKNGSCTGNRKEN